MMVYLHEEGTENGCMAYFNKDALPMVGDEINLRRFDGSDDDRPMAGLWRVMRRRFSGVGENSQRLDYFMERITFYPERVPK